MEYLYERQEALKQMVKNLERDAFNPKIRPKLDELRARLDEINRVIRIMEHEV